MNVRFIYSVFLLFFVLYNTASARTGSISGRVVDPSGKPVAFASVLLLRNDDSSLIKTELTSEKGEYDLTPLADGRYFIKVSLMGYADAVTDKLDVANNAITANTITMEQNSKQLNEVAVRAPKPFVEVHSDKLVVNVENSIVHAGSSVLDVLARSPGVRVDQNDNISLKGKSGVNIMINGKVQPVSGEQLANMLKSMPSNAVESIELISNPSARYDAAGTAGIINIRMKKDTRTGLNGSVNLTHAQGVYPKDNGGFNASYRNKKFNLFLSYNHSEKQGFNHLTLDRNFYTNNIFAGAYVQDNHYLYHFHTNTGSLGLDYNLTPKTVIGMVVSGDNNYMRRDGNNFSDIIDSAARKATFNFTTQNTSSNNWNSYAANLNLRHNINNKGRTLAIDADYASYPSSATQDYITHYNNYTPDGVSVPSGTPDYILRGDLKGITTIRSFKIDYVHPLENNAKVEAGFKSSLVTADNNPRFYYFNGSAYMLDSTKTDHFIYDENINAAYATLSKDWDKWSTQLGLRLEQTIAKGRDLTIDSSFTRNYAQLFPSLAVQRHLDKDNDLGVTLSRRIERPNYEQLNPFKYYLDPTTYKAGYPYLNPALSYSSELSYTYKQRLITTLMYSITTDPITEVIQPSEQERKVTIQTTKNLSTMYYYGVSGAYQFQFFKWWNNTTNLNVYYARYTGDIAGTNLNAGKTTFDINTSNSFILPANWSAELSCFYQAPQVYGYMNLKPSWMLNAGIQKNLLDKRLVIRLNATDIFWHGYPRATSYYNDYVESFIAQRDTRQVTASATWRFGKRTVPQSMRHNGSAEEEKRRVGGQAG